MSEVKNDTASVTVERPSTQYTLEAILRDGFTVEHSTCDPTPDLITLQKGPDIKVPDNATSGYLVWCKDTEETWFAPTEQCLNQNFIYRDDLEIFAIPDWDSAQEWAYERNKNLMPGLITRKTCYILDNPSIEKYEVYYDPSYPSQQYGKCSPQGTTVRQYKDRFQRDMAIMELDMKYSKQSRKSAKAMISGEMGPDQAIIISDGAYIHGNSSCSYFYMDSQGIIKNSECVLPSVKEHGVIIAEINGARRALSLCMGRHKTDITYYYDNTAVVSLLTSKRMDAVSEVKSYKKLLEKMNSLGYKVNFVEIHPKRGETRDEENKALMFFHNACDAECRYISNLFVRDYKGYASTGNKEGTTYAGINQRKKK